MPCHPLLLLLLLPPGRFQGALTVQWDVKRSGTRRRLQQESMFRRRQQQLHIFEGQVGGGVQGPLDTPQQQRPDLWGAAFWRLLLPLQLAAVGAVGLVAAPQLLLGPQVLASIS
jgi:hypothetical protein